MKIISKDLRDGEKLTGAVVKAVNISAHFTI